MKLDVVNSEYNSPDVLAGKLPKLAPQFVHELPPDDFIIVPNPIVAVVPTLTQDVVPSPGINTVGVDAFRCAYIPCLKIIQVLRLSSTHPFQFLVKMHHN